MGRILHPLMALLACATRQELARQVAYLKEENRILRARLPKRLVPTPSPEGTLFETMRACFRASGLTQPAVGS